jgi:anti-anti-sigma factor
MLSDRNEEFLHPVSPARVHPRAIAELSLKGEIDLSNCDEVLHSLSRHFAGPARLFLVDLSDVTLVDARGVGAFLEAQRRARQAGHELVFTNPCGLVARVIALLELHDVLLAPELV